MDCITETLRAETQELAAQILEEGCGGSVHEIAEIAKLLGSKLQLSIETRRIGLAMVSVAHHLAQSLTHTEQCPCTPINCICKV